MHSSTMQQDPALVTDADHRPSQRLHNALHLASPRKSVAFASRPNRASSHVPCLDSPIHASGAVEDKRYSPAKKWQNVNHRVEHRQTWGYGGGMKRSASLATLDMQRPLWRVGSQPCLNPAATATTPVKSPTRRKQ